jgi:hypothetical protein
MSVCEHDNTCACIKLSNWWCIAGQACKQQQQHCWHPTTFGSQQQQCKVWQQRICSSWKQQRRRWRQYV